MLTIVAATAGLTAGVSWPQRSGTVFHSADTAEQCAFILDGDVQWIDEETTEPTEPLPTKRTS